MIRPVFLARNFYGDDVKKGKKEATKLKKDASKKATKLKTGAKKETAKVKRKVAAKKK